MAGGAAAAAEAEAAARRSYGRLLAHLAYQWRDLAAAEDALSTAFATALDRWPRDGIPAAPEGWLMTVARRHLLQAHRHARLADDPAVTVLLQEDEAAPQPCAVPDQRLKLMFVCAHPAIDPSVHTALMLQTVLGLDARRIAGAFLVSPAAMAQRLVRSKAKIAAAGIAFEEPEAADLPGRLHAVLEAIYAAYDLGRDAATGPLAGTGPDDLTQEALYLAELCAALLPDNAEALGLHALLLLCEARRPVVRAARGRFVPLHEQDAALWDRGLIEQADRLLRRSARQAAPGPFQLEAAIQAAHCHRAYSGTVPWPAIARLYGHLVALAPTLGARVGQAVAVAEAQGAAAGLRLLEPLAAAPNAATYQPYWVARGYLHQLAGDRATAREAYRRAMGLTETPAVRDYLEGRLQALTGPEGR